MSQISRSQTKLGRMYTNGTKSYFSTTTILGNIFGKGKFFDTWLKNLGHYADIYTKAKQQRGTFVHELAHILKLDPQCIIDIPYIKDMMHDYLDPVSIQFFKGRKAVADSVMKYLESYLQWTNDYDITYLGSEVMLFHPDLDWAGAVDDPITNHTLGHNMISDIKTGGQYDTHLLQCIAYAILWNKIYPSHPMTAVSVLYIKDEYVKKPIYKYETLELDSPKGKKKIEEWNHVMDIWRIRYANTDGSYPVREHYKPAEELTLNPKIKRDFVDPLNQE